MRTASKDTQIAFAVMSVLSFVLLSLTVWGTWSQTWYAGFALVLFMTSVLIQITLKGESSEKAPAIRVEPFLKQTMHHHAPRTDSRRAS